METTTYNGNDVFAPFNAGLYGIEDDGERSMQFEESKDSILSAFKEEYEEEIASKLEGAGLKLEGFNYYSPRQYNFSTDSIDIELSIVSEDKFKTAMEPLRAKVQAILDANKSYDGYLALTSESFEEAVEGMELPCIRALLSDIDFSESRFYLYEHLEYAYACESCGLIHEDRIYLSKEDEQKVEKCEGNS